MTTDPSRNIPYDPLPLTSEDQRNHGLFNEPPSPDPRLTSFNMEQNYGGPDAVPPGAAPRFLGTALYDDPSLHHRESFTSSHNTINSQNNQDYNASVFALNDQRGAYRDDPNDSYYGSRDAVPLSSVGQSSRMLEEKRAVYGAPASKSRRKILILGILAGLILVILAVIIPVYFAVIRPRSSSEEAQNDSDSTRSTTAARPGTTGVTRIVTGGDGSQITMEDGTRFTYKNSFSGYWYYDEEDPFNNGARAQSWSPALNETFKYGIDKIRGVNIGGWLNTEPFITPALYEQYLGNAVPAVDEWTLSEAMRADVAKGGINQLEEHYKTFITEQDFAEIASAGLNYVRIPIGHWAIETRGTEPFLAHVSWQYFLKAIKWARKYGLRINLDLHTMPGSQNGWNHSGRLGPTGFLIGPMGYANAQRALDIIRVIAEFISQPQYKDVVTIFGIINEPFAPTFGQDALARFYMEAYKIIRTAGGTGEGNGPWISIHDAFLSRSQWVDVMPNADRVTLDSHPYIAFNGQSDADMGTYATVPCQNWGSAVNASMRDFGLTNAGEFSNAVTDCGLYLNGVNLGTRYEGDYSAGGTYPRIGSCERWTDWKKWDQKMKDDIKNFALASMDALQNYFFWTWKIGDSLASGKVETPAWSYKLGLDNGWMPKDPREATGTCGNSSPWQPPLKSWQTGGVGAGDMPPAATEAIAWPPATLSLAGPVSLLPSYTATGPIPTLSPPTLTAASGSATPTVDVGTGWNNPADNAGFVAEIPGCTYLDPWVDPTVAPPSPFCGGAVRRQRIPNPAITPV